MHCLPSRLNSGLNAEVVWPCIRHIGKGCPKSCCPEKAGVPCTCRCRHKWSLLYKTILRPCLEYASVAWDNCSAADREPQLGSSDSNCPLPGQWCTSDGTRPCLNHNYWNSWDGPHLCLALPSCKAYLLLEAREQPRTSLSLLQSHIPTWSL